MTTIELRTSILKDIAALLDDDDAMLKLQEYLFRLKKEKRTEKLKAKQRFKKELENDLREALKEAEEIRKGTVQPATMDDLYVALKEEQ